MKTCVSMANQKRSDFPYIKIPYSSQDLYLVLNTICVEAITCLWGSSAISNTNDLKGVESDAKLYYCN